MGLRAPQEEALRRFGDGLSKKGKGKEGVGLFPTFVTQTTDWMVEPPKKMNLRGGGWDGGLGRGVGRR